MNKIKTTEKPETTSRMSQSQPPALGPLARPSVLRSQERTHACCPAPPSRLAPPRDVSHAHPVFSPMAIILAAVLIRSLVPSFLSAWRSPSLKQFRSHSASSRIPIVTTIFPLQEFARAVAGEKGAVSLLLPPGAGVHTWQPRTSDIRRLHQARLLITIGAGLEPWMEDILRSLPPPGPKVLAAADFLPLIKEKDEKETHGAEEAVAHHPRDPHVWLDFILAQHIVQQIARALSEIDPASAPLYESNAAAYNARLSELDRKFETTIARCQRRVLLIAGHAAFGYLARRYGLEQIALYDLSPDAEPTPGRLMAAIDRAKGLGVMAVFVEANTSLRLARTLAREIGAKIFTLNPGASPTRHQLSSRATFFDIMEENLKAIQKGLGCE